MEVFSGKGTDKIHFQMATPEEQHSMAFTGINTFVLCESMVETVESVWNSLKMFVNVDAMNTGESTLDLESPQYMVDATLDFLDEAMDL